MKKDNEPKTPGKCLEKIAKMRSKVIEEMVLDEYGIHKCQHTVIMYLANSKNIPTQKDIAEYMQVSPAAVAVTLKKLDDEALIERSPFARDARANNVKLSDTGKQIASKSKKFIDKVDAEMLRGFSEEELANLENYLERLIRNIETSAEI